MASDKLKQITDKLTEINKIILKLDPAIRSPAFGILAPFFFEETPGGDTVTEGGKNEPNKVSTADKEEFFNSFDNNKPKDNVFLIVAWFYSQYGLFPITRRMLNEEASKAGLIIPERSDNTMRMAKHKGKTLFRQKSSGWQLTVSGEAFVKETYSVTKGKKPLPSEESA